MEITEAKKELEGIMPNAKKIKDLSGNEITLPVITLGIELKIMHQVFDLIELGGYKDDGSDMPALSEMLLQGFRKDKESGIVLEIVSILIGKPANWLLDNVDTTILVGVLLPFFVTRINQLTEVLGGTGTQKPTTPLPS